MENLPIIVHVAFLIITIVGIGLFYRATKSKVFLGIALIWSLIHSGLTLIGFYQNTTTLPPPIVLGIIPIFLGMLIFVISKKSNAFIDKIDFEKLHHMHLVRIVVEIILTTLFHYGVINQIQTWEGLNYDIIPGLTAIPIAFLFFRKRAIGKKGLLAWNIISMIVLLGVVTSSSLALPSPLQQIGFDQPNIAIMYFPFNLLPHILVPTVLFAHMLTIKWLVR